MNACVTMSVMNSNRVRDGMCVGVCVRDGVMELWFEGVYVCVTVQMMVMVCQCVYL